MGKKALSSLACAAFLATAATAGDPVPWGSFNFNNASCPIRYPFGNETVFCKSVGMQRALVSFQQSPGSSSQARSSDTVCVSLPWRRRDDPARVGLVVLDEAGRMRPAALRDASGSVPVLDAESANVTGRVCFSAGAKEEAREATERLYSVYFMPYGWSFDGGSGSYHSHFLAPESAGPVLPPPLPSSSSSSTPPAPAPLPIEAKLVRFESYSDFDRRSPMELIASKAEVGAAIAQAPASARARGYLTWVSTIRNTTDQTLRMPALPHELAMTPTNTSVVVEIDAAASKRSGAGSVTVLQVVLFASSSTDLESIDVEFGDVGGLPASAFTCFHCEGRDYHGRAMKPPPLHIASGTAGQLLIGLTLPASDTAAAAAAAATTLSGSHRGTFMVKPANLPATTIDVEVRVTPAATASDKNDDDKDDASSLSPLLPPPGSLDTSDVWRLERMAWLNSDIGIEEAQITRPYTPLILLEPSAAAVEAGRASLSCLGRTITLGPSGLPATATSNGRQVLAPAGNGVEFVVKVIKEGARRPGGHGRWQQDSIPVRFSVPASTAAPSSPPAITMGPGNASATWSVDLVPALNPQQDAERAAEVEGLRLRIDGRMEYDGHLDFAATLTTTPASSSSSSSSVALADAFLQVDLAADVSRFAVGAGFGDNGALFPASNTSVMHWRWGTPTSPSNPGPAGNPSAPAGWRVWMGDVDAGLFLKLKGGDLSWNRARGGSTPPASWANAGLGGINVSTATATSPTSPTAAAAAATTSSNPGGGEDDRVDSDDGIVTISAYGGPRTIASGQQLVFNFSIAVTPVKGDYVHTAEGKTEHYQDTRHYHVPYGQWDPPTAPALQEELGITVQILHQSNRLNPYIDWPFHPKVMPALDSFVKDARDAGVRVKLYYTVGQLSNHAVELFALASLPGGEVLLRNTSNVPPAPGTLGGMGETLQGNEWLEEHMVEGYEGGWFTMNPGHDEDASITDNVTSRFMNYYIEGQRWLYDELGLGGLYYDGFDAERFVQQRIRRMSSSSPSSSSQQQPARFDVHGRAFQNTELLPFVDSMWTCEGIDFTKGPAYWLVSISSLPFGVFGEMLGADKVLPTPGKFCGESCANKWRGMLFGMSNRAGWTGHDPNDNRGLWRLWDAVAIHEATMYGWWNRSSPIQLVRDNTEEEKQARGRKLQRARQHDEGEVLATAYVRPGNLTLIAIASWSTANVSVKIAIDWAKIGIPQSEAVLSAPGISSFNRNGNTTRIFALDKPIVVPPLQGWLLVVQKRPVG